jgi:PqqD family protein of HPr-rel-A system
MKWFVRGVERFTVRTWDDEAVLFHQGTSDTHFLDALGLEVFYALCAEPCTLQQLALTLSEQFEIDNDTHLRDAICKVVEQFRIHEIADEIS